MVKKKRDKKVGETLKLKFQAKDDAFVLNQGIIFN